MDYEYKKPETDCSIKELLDKEHELYGHLKNLQNEKFQRVVDLDKVDEEIKRATALMAEVKEEIGSRLSSKTNEQ